MLDVKGIAQTVFTNRNVRTIIIMAPIRPPIARRVGQNVRGEERMGKEGCKERTKRPGSSIGNVKRKMKW